MILGLLDGDGGDETLRLSFGLGLFRGAGFGSRFCLGLSLSYGGGAFARFFFGFFAGLRGNGPITASAQLLA